MRGIRVTHLQMRANEKDDAGEPLTLKTSVFGQLMGSYITFSKKESKAVSVGHTIAYEGNLMTVERIQNKGDERIIKLGPFDDRLWQQSPRTSKSPYYR